MATVSATGLAFAYGDAAPLFHRVDLRLVPGLYGLVGENGAGKSTLLALLAGALVPGEGRVLRAPVDAIVVTCAQSVQARGDDVVALAERDDRNAVRLRATMGLDEAPSERWGTLSPGERKRWQIAAALAREPDVLFLDEPTNHIDAQGRRRLVSALASFRGVGVIVSHDRSLLDEVTTRTLRIREGRVDEMPGSYGPARAEWERQDEALRDRRQALRGQLDTAARKLADARRRRAAAEHETSSRARMKGPRDHDARGMLRKGNAMRAEASLGKEVGARQSELARTTSALAGAASAPREPGGALFVDWVPCPRRSVLSLHAREVRAGEAPCLRDVAMDVGREERVRIAGANGAGKTTLLQALAGAGAGKSVFYLPQDTHEESDRRALDAVRALGPRERGRVLSFVAALGVDPARLLASNRPSPGEARKLHIADALGRGVWALVLDEPTNHLDLPSVERLEGALASYPGALVLVTHDDAFARACRCETRRIEDGRLTR
ncbi:MAG TPA: ATP-binding cassette domain-containing protein [Polyangiaceae bacterium]|jgi:ATPase subunit of ABC transporter with duplicated ATPase domains